LRFINFFQSLRKLRLRLPILFFTYTICACAFPILFLLAQFALAFYRLKILVAQFTLVH